MTETHLAIIRCGAGSEEHQQGKDGQQPRLPWSSPVINKRNNLKYKHVRRKHILKMKFDRDNGNDTPRQAQAPQGVQQQEEGHLPWPDSVRIN